MVLMALGLGLIFSGRAFCSLLCPAGAVFGLYARFSPMRLFIADRGVCSGCQEQGCVRSGEVVRRFALGRALLFWKGWYRGSVPEAQRHYYAMALLLGVLLVSYGALLGGDLVYMHGVGVRAG